MNSFLQLFHLWPAAVEIVGIASGLGGLALSTWPYISEPLFRAYENLHKSLEENYSYLKSFDGSLEKLQARKEEFWDLYSDALNYECKWIEDADKITDDLTKLVEAAEKETSRASMLNVRTRIRLARLLQEMLKVVESLLDKGALEIAALSDATANASRGVTQPSRALVGQEAVDVVKKIYKFLTEDENVRIVGVCGPSGVGKTEVMRVVNNRALQALYRAFDRVIWVDVQGGSDDILIIQRRLARVIGLGLSDQDDARKNSEELLGALSALKNVLLIIDGMLKSLPFEEIGIPGPTTDNQFKLVVVSRFSSVCNGMGANKLVDLNLVSCETTWELFLEELVRGRISRVLPEATELVIKDVAKESGSLPLEIILVARTLRKMSYDLPEWQDSLSSLRRCLRISMSEEEKTLARLRFCYEMLHDAPSKLCFLYTAIFPLYNVIEVEELMGYWIWEGLLGDVEWVDLKIKQAKEILHTLKEAGLLDGVKGEDQDEFEQVTMHPLVREMAIFVVARVERSNFVPEFGLERELDWPTDALRISLIRRGLMDLSNRPAQCPNLSSLLMQHNPFSGDVYDDFFCAMPNLQVLNLSYSSIRLLPQSLSRLNKLQALFLRGCAELRRLPTLSELSELLVLDLTDTPIQELPSGLHNLTKLKRLVLTCTRHLVFPPGLLQAFRDSLQELLVDSCGFLWQSRSSSTSGQMASADELSHLHNLSIMEVNFANAHAYQEYLMSGHLRQLKRFKFSVGGWRDGRSVKNSMEVIGGLMADDSNLILLPNFLLELHVAECHDISHLEIQGLSYLKTLVVVDCSKLEYLFQVTELQELKFLEEITVKGCQNIALLFKPGEAGNGNQENQISLSTPLQKLTLFDLPRLELIFDRKLSCDSLKSVTIWKCDILKDIPFPNFSLDGTEIPGVPLKVIADKSWYDAMFNASGYIYWQSFMVQIEHPPISQMAYRVASSGNIETKKVEETSISSEIQPVVTFGCEG